MFSYGIPVREQKRRVGDAHAILLWAMLQISKGRVDTNDATAEKSVVRYGTSPANLSLIAVGTAEVGCPRLQVLLLYLAGAPSPGPF
jgi:hypothetical protein